MRILGVDARLADSVEHVEQESEDAVQWAKDAGVTVISIVVTPFILSDGATAFLVATTYGSDEDE